MIHFGDILQKYSRLAPLGGEDAGRTPELVNELNELKRSAKTRYWIYVVGLLLILTTGIGSLIYAAFGGATGFFGISAAAGVSIPWCFIKLREISSDQSYSELTIFILGKANPRTTEEVIQILTALAKKTN